MGMGEVRPGVSRVQAVGGAAPGERALRGQLVDAAVGLFVKQGYHETTTREIAEAAGWTVGALYDFVKSKGDILYHVCGVIHEETEALLEGASLEGRPAGEALCHMLDTYLRACDARQDVILLIYQESNCLAPELRALVMRNEERITACFYHLIERGGRAGVFRAATPDERWLAAHNIIVIGQMWAFRRWYLQKHYTLEEYVRLQTEIVLRLLAPR